MSRRCEWAGDLPQPPPRSGRGGSKRKATPPQPPSPKRRGGARQPLPPPPCPKRRGGASSGERWPQRLSSAFLPLSASGRGPGGGVLPPPLRFGEGAGGRGSSFLPLSASGRGPRGGVHLRLPLSASGRGPGGGVLETRPVFHATTPATRHSRKPGASDTWFLWQEARTLDAVNDGNGPLPGSRNGSRRCSRPPYSFLTVES